DVPSTARAIRREAGSVGRRAMVASPAPVWASSVPKLEVVEKEPEGAHAARVVNSTGMWRCGEVPAGEARQAQSRRITTARPVVLRSGAQGAKDRGAATEYRRARASPVAAIRPRAWRLTRSRFTVRTETPMRAARSG